MISSLSGNFKHLFDCAIDYEAQHSQIRGSHNDRKLCFGRHGDCNHYRPSDLIITRPIPVIPTPVERRLRFNPQTSDIVRVNSKNEQPGDRREDIYCSSFKRGFKALQIL